MEKTLSISGALASNFKNRIVNLKQSYLNNISQISEFLDQNDISTSYIHSICKETAHEIYPYIRNMFGIKDSDKSKYYRQIMIKVSKARFKISENLYISDNVRDINAMISMYFASVTFMYAIEFAKYTGFKPVHFTSIYFAPIIEEVGKFVTTNFTESNFYMGYRINFRLFFVDLYLGRYKFRVSDLENLLKILFNTYRKLFSYEDVQGISKMGTYLQYPETIELSNLVYLSILLAGFIPETEDLIFKITSVFDEIMKFESKRRERNG